ncbi:hypothetical protein BKA69DRAFT_79173 [Paraphysoderma sedebokerense]|nr:hypothetical protein BKA69DRAFT_79173 [Paraphysoderma sedebokerense]
MWISNNMFNSTLYNFRLAPFEISHISVVDANLSRIRENNTMRIEFSVPPAELQLVDLSYVPVVYVRDKPSLSVRWNNNTLDVSVPRGAGIGLRVRVEFPYLGNKPTIEISTNFSYAPPSITSIEPRAVPTAGGTRLKIKVENIGDVGDIQALVGLNNATCVDIVLEDGGFSCNAPPGTAKERAQLLVESGSQTSNLNWEITYYEPIISIPVTIQENLVQSNVPLTMCPDYLGLSDQLEYRIVEVPDITVGTLFESNSSTHIMQGKDVFVSDIKGSISYLPSVNFHGSFTFKYYCRDKSDGSKTNSIAVEISVLPYLSCQPEALISDIITLTERNLVKDKLWLSISHGPKNGSIISIKSASVLPIEPEEVFQEESVRYVANYSVERRTSLPVDEITYYAVNDINMKSKPCTLRFSISCAPLFLNVFNKSLPRVCASCPNNAVCSPNGDQAPVPNRGHWRGTDDVFLPCASQKACPANGNGECGPGYTGIRTSFQSIFYLAVF